MTGWRDPRFFLALLLIGLFAAAYFKETEPDEMMKGAMIGAFAAAYGYWLGSSSGSRAKDELLADKGEE
jgi:hypothetical protein